ncbi:MAG TPA: ROK family protein [Clostridiales bacterium]|nr:ROK family protein [Clostridiales bacterium]
MLIGSIDIGGTKTMVGIVSPDGQILSKLQFNTERSDPKAWITHSCGRLKECIHSLGYDLKELSGIGVSLPGIVNRERNILVRTVYPEWNNLRAVELVQRLLGIHKVVIDNDVNACAIGEMYFGHRDLYRNYLWVTVSTGIGGALVCEGRLIRGYNGSAGEVGHMKVEFDHPLPCPCGQYGCLEAHGSGTAIKHYIEEEIRNNRIFSDLFDSLGLSKDAAGCARLAKDGNGTAIEIYRKAAVYIGRGLGYAVNLLNPEVVIIGGGVGSSLDILKDGILGTIHKTVNPALLPVDVVRTRLGYDAAFLGAAALVIDQMKTE